MAKIIGLDFNKVTLNHKICGESASIWVKGNIVTKKYTVKLYDEEGKDVLTYDEIIKLADYNEYIIDILNRCFNKETNTFLRCNYNDVKRLYYLCYETLL